MLGWVLISRKYGVLEEGCVCRKKAEEGGYGELLLEL